MRSFSFCTVQVYCTTMRAIHSTALKSKIVPSNVKSASSNEWVKRHLNDPYVKKSRYHNYRCRSAFKLIEIEEKYQILRPGLSVVDLGAAPGSWSQVVVRKLNSDATETSEKKGFVVSVDLQHFEPIPGAIILENRDFMQTDTQNHIASLLPDGTADVVLSDMAPKATGTRDLDVANISTLVYGALKFCTKTLIKDGVFVCKMWNCESISQMLKNMQVLFDKARIVKPNASYMDSSEVFILCTGFKKPGNIKK